MGQLQRAGKDGSRRGMQAIFDRGPPPPCPAPFNLAAYVLHRAQQLANKTALAVIREDGAECWSYAELEAAVLGAASGFLSQGLKPGDRLLMSLMQTAPWEKDHPGWYVRQVKCPHPDGTFPGDTDV